MDEWKEESAFPNAWEEGMEELRKSLVLMGIELKRRYKPTMIERIICHIRFKQLKHLTERN